jgi:C1A family cysteine protease
MTQFMKPGLPLQPEHGLTPAQILALRQLWITQVEEFLSLTRLRLDSLATALDVPPEQLRPLAGQVSERTGVPIPDASLGPGDTLPTGALAEPDEDKALGGPDQPDISEIAPRVNLIAEFDAVRDQHSRNTCVSFAITALHEYARRRAGQPVEDLSEQFLHYYTKQLDEQAGETSQGESTTLLQGLDALLSHGQCLETTWPYQPEADPANNWGQEPPSPTADAEAQPPAAMEYKLLDHTSPNNLKAWLTAGYPIAVTVRTYRSWLASPFVRWQSGAVTLPLPGEPKGELHAVCLIGYETDPAVPGGGYFLFRNSYGLDWAQESPYAPGYGLLPFAYVRKDGDLNRAYILNSPSLP